jgi:predicted transcriptional regulator
MQLSDINTLTLLEKMKTLKMKQLDEKDEKIADALIALGFGRNVAMTLAYIQNANLATSLELERAAKTHQPEVSIAIRQLKNVTG